MLTLLAALQVAVAADSLPTVTLAEALRLATGLDPSYVAAIGQVDNAQWARRSAFAVFLLPSVALETDATRNLPAFFNFGTLRPERYSVQAQMTLRYDLFTGGQKVAELARSAAALDSAHAGVLKARFAAALFTESDYYAVLSGAELARVARERVQRAEHQLAVARARVVSGAAVQTDSLQLRLELSQARVALLRQETDLRVSRLTLGSRVGATGPVNAAPLDSVLPAELPLTLDAAVAEAANQGPRYRLARANERAAAAVFRSQLGAYLPRASLTGTGIVFDNKFYPTGSRFSQLTLTVQFPLWDNFRRESAVSQARVNRDVTRATRDTVERSVRRDVAAAYDGFTTARASADLAREQLQVARENFRVQQSRYRAGATTILDLLKAESDLDDAEAALVQARYATRLALAGLETILGRRLFPEPQPK
ncbi:MAG TPA: TolC family protein [Gemmatimonadales bacterium]|jgi:outer membrane protein|nr:TolC family protein [Gemmatimonadales bacterium]